MSAGDPETMRRRARDATLLAVRDVTREDNRVVVQFGTEREARSFCNLMAVLVASRGGS